MLPSLAVIGAQWGDEGKGKITDYLDGAADVIVRFQGGNNAGHTIKAGGKVFKLHSLPSGVARGGSLAIIGNGTVVNVEDLIEEMGAVARAGGSLEGLRISDRAHLVMDYHKGLDGAEERYRGGNVVGTTRKGVGPAYQDKSARIGIRAGDLLEDGLVSEKVGFILPYKEDVLSTLGSAPDGCDHDAVRRKMRSWRESIGRYICDTSALVNDALDDGKRVLFEGAQGAMLDIDHGTYPYVTSSSTCSGGICTGAGVAPGRIGQVVGCMKAYTTRVGEGPFVTEMFGEEAEALRKKGGEFGVTTGRGRRCGWLDLVAIGHASRICGFTSYAVTKLDILNGLEEVRACVAYDIDGEETRRFPASISKLERARPVYRTMKGWEGWDDTAAVVKGGYDALPEEMRAYISFIEGFLKVPVDIISIGPDREDTIDRNTDWWG